MKAFKAALCGVLHHHGAQKENASINSHLIIIIIIAALKSAYTSEGKMVRTDGKKTMEVYVAIDKLLLDTVVIG